MSRFLAQHLSTGCKITMIAAVAVFLCGQAPAATLDLPAGSGYVVSVEVNRQPLRLRVDPGGFAEIALNPAAAERAGLQTSSSSLIGMVGPVKLRGRFAKAPLTVNGSRFRAKFIWFNRTVFEGVDGVISPSLLPYEQVNFLLPGKRSVGTTTILPIRLHSQLGIMHDLSVSGSKVPVRLTLIEPHTTATAAAGAIIAAQQSGSWAGAATPYRVRWKVERPVRPMRLQHHLAVGPLTIDRLLVRTADYRGKHQLPQEQSADPSEIVITGSRPSRQKALVVLTLAADRLLKCSFLQYHHKQRQLRLTC